MTFMGMTIWIRGARLKTLPLAIAPVLIGASLAWRDAGERRVAVAVLCGFVALLLQIAANFANDYSDGIRGTDAGRAIADEQVSRGPARLVASGVNPKKALVAAGICALAACLCGLAVIALTGYWWFILVGIACLAAGWCYVGGKHPYGYHYLGEIFVFIFFGLVATCGTMFALSGTITPDGLLGGSAAGLVAVAVLCVNNLRDIERQSRQTYVDDCNGAAKRHYLHYCNPDYFSIDRVAPSVAIVDICGKRHSTNRNYCNTVCGANCRIIRNRKKNLPQSIAAMFARFVDCRSDFRAIDDACITFA